MTLAHSTAMACLLNSAPAEVAVDHVGEEANDGEQRDEARDRDGLAAAM